MDYQKKKLLTQSVAFLQTHLNLSNEMLEDLITAGVLTREEVIIVQKDQTRSGKVLELICTLKRKDTRTFNQFLEVLETNSCHIVAEVLQKTQPGEIVKADARTMNVLENHLPDVPLKELQNLSAYLVPSEIYHDDITSLHEQIKSLQQAMADSMQGGLGPRQPSNASSNGGEAQSTGRSTGRNTPSVSGETISGARWDVPSQMDELKQVLKQKDEIIRKKDEEYAKLRKILSDTQNDMQGVLDLNSQYLMIIGQLNAMTALGGGASTSTNTGTRQPSGGSNHDDYMELEAQMEAAKQRIEQLQIECSTIETKRLSQQQELEKTLSRERKYKQILGLSIDADEVQVMEKIQQLMEDGSMQKSELDRIRKELSKVTHSRTSLEDKLTSLEREKEKIEFHMRQQDLTIKKMNRQRTANEVIQRSEHMMSLVGTDPRRTTQLRLPSIERAPTGIALASSTNAGTGKNKTVTQFCMFCRAEFTPLKPGTCRAHFRSIRGGKWTCCRDDCHRSAGCLQLPHFYIEITVDKKIFLTDGARYMELT